MKTPGGVRFLSACEMFLSLIVGFLGLMYLVYAFYGVIHLQWLRVANSFGITALLLAVAALLFFAGKALTDGVRWAWNASAGIGLLVAFFAAYCLRASQKAGQPTWEAGAGLLILVLALMGLAILMLPSTRRFYQQP